jgi:hypothetical protein
MSFVWIVTFYLWNFQNTSFGLVKQFDCDSMGVYWNTNLLHKNKYCLKILPVKESCQTFKFIAILEEQPYDVHLRTS